MSDETLSLSRARVLSLSRSHTRALSLAHRGKLKRHKGLPAANERRLWRTAVKYAGQLYATMPLPPRIRCRLHIKTYRQTEKQTERQMHIQTRAHT